MALKKTCLYAAECDRCGPGWWHGHDGLDAEPLFATRRCARRELARYFGWTVTGRRQHTRMLCRSCARRAEPASPARNQSPHTQHANEAAGPSASRPAIPPGHPESLTRELGDAAEELLAELDAELFGTEDTW